VFIHQLAREYWWSQTRGAFRLAAPIGYLLEPLSLRCYRFTRAITISPSSADDLRALGVRDVSVIPMAVEREPVVRMRPRGPGLRLVAVGRMEPAKHVEQVIEAFAYVQARVPEATLDLVGGGAKTYRIRLDRLVAARRLQGVTFHGRVPAERKWQLLELAHFHVFASHREGWGLTVTEAAAVGTPSVGYAAPGVRDSIGEPELLARGRTAGALAGRILAVHDNPALYERLREQVWRRTQGMTWTRTADDFAQALLR
jgi:glycosyltransferase involved in cell wall biosynthesis